MPSVARPESFVLIAQLSYASADGVGSTGGWQVKQTVGELDAATTVALTRRMPTTIEPTFPMPEYPVDGLPRRMLVSAVSANDARIAVWHSAPAGRDASSRPGNVYTQCALLAPTIHRPSFLWGSPEWRTPFGPKEVAATALPADLSASAVAPFPGLAEFLFDPQRWRVGTLAVIVDAVQHALEGGPIVVLEVDDHEEAARWICAVSLCTDAVSAQAIHSCTYERARSRDLWPNLGLHLVGVPRADDAQLATLKGVVVIDTATDATLGNWGGEPHRTHRGDEIAVTPWSVLMLSRCVGGDDLVNMADLADLVRARLPESVWAPAWPLAVREFAEDPNPAAADVLAHSTPTEVEAVPEFYGVVAAALGTLLGEDSESRWRALRELTAKDSSLVLSLAAGSFVTGAVNEPAWLAAQPESPRVPGGAAPSITGDQRDSVLAGLRAQLEPGEPNAEWALGAMRSIDLTVSIGWAEGEIEGQLFSLASHLAIIADDRFPWFDSVVRGAAEPSRAYLREALLGLEGTVPSDAVLGLLGLATGEFLNSDDAITDDKVRPIAAAAARLVLASPKVEDMLRGRSQLLQLRFDLEGRSHSPEIEPPVVIEPADLADLVGRFGRAVPGRVLLAVTLANLGTSAIDDLAQALFEVGHPQREAVDAFISLSHPITTRGSLNDYWQGVGELESVVQSRMIAQDALPRSVLSRAQAITLAALVVSLTPLTDPLHDTSAPLLPEAEVTALGVLMARDRYAFRSIAEAVTRIARCTVDSPERAPAVPLWAVELGPVEDPLIDQIVSAAVRAAGLTFDNDMLEVATYSLLREDGHRPRTLLRYLTKWVGARNLATTRGGPTAWLKRVTNLRQEED